MNALEELINRFEVFIIRDLKRPLVDDVSWKLILDAREERKQLVEFLGFVDSLAVRHKKGAIGQAQLKAREIHKSIYSK